MQLTASTVVGLCTLVGSVVLEYPRMPYSAPNADDQSRESYNALRGLGGSCPSSWVW
jgi:hypothetical protein